MFMESNCLLYLKSGEKKVTVFIALCRVVQQSWYVSNRQTLPMSRLPPRQQRNSGSPLIRFFILEKGKWERKAQVSWKRLWHGNKGRKCCWCHLVLFARYAWYLWDHPVQTGPSLEFGDLCKKFGKTDFSSSTIFLPSHIFFTKYKAINKRQNGSTNKGYDCGYNMLKARQFSLGWPDKESTQVERLPAEFLFTIK